MRQDKHGFTLLEMCLTLVVMSVLLGGLMRPLLNNREQLLQRRAGLQMDDAREALLGFLAAEGRLPCPASLDSGGAEQREASGVACVQYAGYLPVVQLGLAGALDAQGLLLDPWGARLRYRLSDVDSDADGEADFVSEAALRRAGLGRLEGDLKVLHWQGQDCGHLQLRASHVVSVVYSDGRRSHDGAAELLNRAMGKRFSTGAFSASPACGFDDQLRWLPDSAVFSQLLRAHRLP